jgi:hypothetical protein
MMVNMAKYFQLAKPARVVLGSKSMSFGGFRIQPELAVHAPAEAHV